MNNDGIDFDLITPTVLTRPEVCMVCLNSDDPDDYFGRLNFREPRMGLSWPVQYCPMHKMALKDGTLSIHDTVLWPTNVRFPTDG